MRKTTLALLVLFAACAKGGAPDGKKPTGGDPGPTSPGPTNPDPTNPDPTGPDPLASSLHEVRAVYHVHSVFSHDACDANGLPGGMKNMECWNQMRDGICASGLQFVGLTDHPAHMREYSMDGELLFDGSRGDAAIVEGGATVGNTMKCPDGHTVIVTEGYEANHTLPIAFTTQPTTDSAYGNVEDSRPIGDVQAMVAELKSHGALVATAHSEGDDVSAATLLASGIEAMEWYNPHGNFKTVLGAENGIGLGAIDALGLISSFSPFLTGSSSGAHPDLVYLLLLPKWPQKGFDKWRTVQQTRTVTGIFGTDVHQDVSVQPICTGASAIACQLAAQGLSGGAQAVALLAAGGQIVMSDGQRIDQYARLFRWLENRTLVADVTPAGVRDALRAGHNYGLFSIFGAPDGFRYAGLAGTKLVEMGDQEKGPIALTLRVPKRALAQTGAQWTDSDAAKVELRASLYKTDGSGTTLVKETTTLGDTLTFNATAPGAYHVEIWNKPKHMVSAMGTQSSLADTEYMWLITNPIRVLP